MTVPAEKRFVKGVAEALAAKARRGKAGEMTLRHLALVVPTAQAGRRVRFALARLFPEGLVPPLVRLPAQFALPREAENLASRADTLVAFWEALGGEGTLDKAAQLADIRSILGAGALTFAQVAEKVGDILSHDLADVEIERWQKLAEIEKRYLLALEKRGKVDPTLAAREAVQNPEPMEGVEEGVLAGLLDPLPLLHAALETLAHPVTEILPAPPKESPLKTEQIVPSGTAAAESGKIAEIFASVKADEALPALCLADASLFPEVEGALEAKGFTVHNPSATPLAESSLGHLLAQIVALKRTRSYAVFSSFIRGGDARRWIRESLQFDEKKMTDALIDLDNRQAEYLPGTMEDLGPKTQGALRAIYEFVAKELRKKDVRGLLAGIFKNRTLCASDASAREFTAAAEAANKLIDECADVPEAIALDLFARRLKETTYNLEPDEGDVVLTDGWLELPFLEADELIIAGFEEGCVPESVVGHAFLPDALRRGLGLPDNLSRAARDRRILDMALASRARGAVRIFFHGFDAKGDVLKPSRLLFEGADDAALVKRVKLFYGQKAGTGETSAPDLPRAWRLNLPVPPERKALEFSSPSSLDLYLKCPFTYFLSKTFGERMDDLAEELQPNEFGNLAHAALEAWAQGPLKDSEDEEAIARALADEVQAALAARFGTAVPVIVDLQAESLKRRLRAFARAQVAWFEDGWRIVASERKLAVRYDHTRVKGRSDRIDRNIHTGEWCVIDYKTWDTAERAVAYDAKKGVWLGLQLPLYCAMLDVDPAFPEAKRDKIRAAYCVLGKTEAVFTEPLSGELVPEAEKVVRGLIARIESGVFWPPGKDRLWRWDFAQWMKDTPEESVNEDWIRDQERRLAAGEEAPE